MAGRPLSGRDIGGRPLDGRHIWGGDNPKMAGGASTGVTPDHIILEGDAAPGDLILEGDAASGLILLEGTQ